MLASGVSQLDKRSPEVILEPNAKYWNKSRTPQSRIVFDNIVGKAEAIASVAAGDGKVDVVTMLTPAEAKAFKSDKAKIVKANAKTVLAGVFNKDKPEWQDIKLRQALNMAVDRADVLKKGADGYGLLMPAFIQEGRVGFDPSIKAYAHDAAAAKAVIEASPLKGKTVNIQAGPGQEAIVAAIGDSLKAVGLSAVVVAPPAAGAPSNTAGNWDLKLVEHFDWSPGFAPGVVHREFFGKGGGFRSGAPDANFDALYDKLLATTDAAAQVKVTQEIERYVHDQANVLFLYSPNTLFAVSDRVTFQPYETWMLELAETRVNGAARKAEAK